MQSQGRMPEAVHLKTPMREGRPARLLLLLPRHRFGHTRVTRAAGLPTCSGLPKLELELLAVLEAEAGAGAALRFRSWRLKLELGRWGFALMDGCSAPDGLKLRNIKTRCFAISPGVIREPPAP